MQKIRQVLSIAMHHQPSVIIYVYYTLHYAFRIIVEIQQNILLTSTLHIYFVQHQYQELLEDSY